MCKNSQTFQQFGPCPLAKPNYKFSWTGTATRRVSIFFLLTPNELQRCEQSGFVGHCNLFLVGHVIIIRHLIF